MLTSKHTNSTDILLKWRFCVWWNFFFVWSFVFFPPFMFRACFFCIKCPEMSESVSKCPEMALSGFFCLRMSLAFHSRIFLLKRHTWSQILVYGFVSTLSREDFQFYFSSIGTINRLKSYPFISIFQFYFSSIGTGDRSLQREPFLQFQFYFSSIGTQP